MKKQFTIAITALCLATAMLAVYCTDVKFENPADPKNGGWNGYACLQGDRCTEFTSLSEWDACYPVSNRIHKSQCPAVQPTCTPGVNCPDDEGYCTVNGTCDPAKTTRGRCETAGGTFDAAQCDTDPPPCTVDCPDDAGYCTVNGTCDPAKTTRGECETAGGEFNGEPCGVEPATYALRVNRAPAAGGGVTVTANGNAANPDSSTHTAGTNVTITAAADSGYKFKEWTFESDPAVELTGPRDSATARFNMPASGVTATANFTRLFTVKVVSGTLAGGAGEGRYAAGETVSVTANPPTGDSVFYRWTAVPDVVTFGKRDSSTTAFTMPDTAVTVTATYRGKSDPPPVEYDVTVIGGDGSSKYEIGETVPISATTPAGGYRFVNWTSVPSIDFNLDSSKTEFVMPDTNVTVTANFIRVFTVTFSRNGGTSAAIPDAVVDSGAALGDKYPSDPARTGYTFEGWYDGDTLYTESTPGVTKRLFLSARWGSIKYKVTFDTDGGVPSIIEPRFVDSNATLGTLFPTPTKEGYTFGGWFEGNTQYTASSPIRRDVNLTAKWTKADTWLPGKVCVTGNTCSDIISQSQWDACGSGNIKDACPADPTQDNADIAAAKKLVEDAIYGPVPQDTLNAEATAKARVEAVIAKLSLNGVITEVTRSGNFTAAVAGTANNPPGTNGSYTFTVKLNKNIGTEAVTTVLTLTITATPYADPNANSYRDMRWVTGGDSRWENGAMNYGEFNFRAWEDGTATLGSTNGQWFTSNNILLVFVASSGSNVYRWPYIFVGPSEVALISELGYLGTGGFIGSSEKKQTSAATKPNVTLAASAEVLAKAQADFNTYYQMVDMVNIPPAARKQDPRLVDGTSNGWFQDNTPHAIHHYRKDIDSDEFRFAVVQGSSNTILANGTWFTVNNTFLRVTHPNNGRPYVVDYLYTIAGSTLYTLSFQAYEAGDFRMFEKKANSSSFPTNCATCSAEIDKGLPASYYAILPDGHSTFDPTPCPAGGCPAYTQ